MAQHTNTNTDTERTAGQRLFTHLTVTFCWSVILMLATQVIWNTYLITRWGWPELDFVGALLVGALIWFVLTVGTNW